jgi:hypothetical protein
MRRTPFIIAGLPLLLASTASFAADLGTPQTISTSGPGYTLTATGGVVAFGMPSQGTGVINSGAGTFDPSTSPIDFGLMGALSGSVDVGKTGNTKLSIGFNVFGELATGSDIATDTYTGLGTVIVPGYTTPVGTITLTTTQGAVPASTSAITGTPVVGVDDTNQTVSGAGVNNDQIGVDQPPPPNAFSLGIATNKTPIAAAYGAIASTAGGIFVGTGNLSGLKVTTTESQSVFYGGADINLAATGDLSDGVTLQGYIGPSYKYLGQHNTTTTSIAPPAATVGLVMPTYSDIRTEDFASNYFGGLVGANLTTKVSDKMKLTLGGQFGLYDMWSTFSGSEAYNIGGGSGAVGLPIASQTVTNANTVSGSSNGTAYSAGLNGAITMAMSDTMDVSFGGNAQYLSAVPVMNRAGSVSTVTGTGGANATYTGTGTNTPTMGFASMWNLGGTVSVTGHF